MKHLLKILKPKLGCCWRLLWHYIHGLAFDSHSAFKLCGYGQSQGCCAWNCLELLSTWLYLVTSSRSPRYTSSNQSCSNKLYDVIAQVDSTCVCPTVVPAYRTERSALCSTSSSLRNINTCKFMTWPDEDSAPNSAALYQALHTFVIQLST